MQATWHVTATERQVSVKATAIGTGGGNDPNLSRHITIFPVAHASTFTGLAHHWISNTMYSIADRHLP